MGDQTDAAGHSYNAVVTAPTCTEGGYTTCTCTVCGSSYVDNQTDATGHTYDTVVTAPTCTEGGYTTYICAVCGDTYNDDSTAALGHDYQCTESDGYYVYTCTHCGHSYSEAISVVGEWISLGTGTRFVLDTDGIDIGADHKYIIVGSGSNMALTLSGSTIGAASVTVSNNVITLSDPSKYAFYFVDNSSKESNTYLITQNGTQTVYHMGGNIYYGSDNKGYWYIGSGSSGQYQLYDYDNMNWFLNYGYVWGSESVSRFAVSSTSRTVRLFKAEDRYARLNGRIEQIYADCDQVALDTILQSLSIDVSSNGSDVSETVAVTSSMITWDTDFNGMIAGTYTGTVTYEGEVLGTVTVEVTSVHTYETAVTAPTCTEEGYTAHTCIHCGYSYTDQYTDAVGHSYTSEESDGCMVYTCRSCGDSYSEKLDGFSNASALISGKKHVITLYSNGVYYALSHANDSISLMQITVVDGTITSEVGDDLIWSYNGSKLSYQSGSSTYYLYAQTNRWWWWSSTTLTLSTSSSSSVSFSSNRLKVGSSYLNYSNGGAALNSSGSAAYIFAEN